jgi:hypothetical protein
LIVAWHGHGGRRRIFPLMFSGLPYIPLRCHSEEANNADCWLARDTSADEESLVSEGLDHLFSTSSKI